MPDTGDRLYECERIGTDAGPRVVGVMFLGRTPPKGFETKPGGRYRLPTDPRSATAPAAPEAHGERRRHERLQLFVNLRGLQVERVETVVAAGNLDLLGFFYASGMRPAERLSFFRAL